MSWLDSPRRWGVGQTAEERAFAEEYLMAIKESKSDMLIY